MNDPSRPAARAGLYRLLALAFAPPERVLAEAIRSGDFQGALAACAAAAGIGVGAVPACAVPDETLEAAYLELFEVGKDGAAACALRESSHVGFACEERFLERDGGTPTLMEDLLRFYHFFGFQLSRAPARKLPPDHLVCQLEMLSRLCDREADAAMSAAQIQSCRRAQQDFLNRHLAPWWPRALERLRGIRRAEPAHDFYLALAELALDCVAAHDHESFEIPAA